MYLVTFCFLPIILLVSYFDYIGIILIILLFGFLFNPIYKWDINRKIKKIKRKNPNANKEQLNLIITKKGGTSKLALILSIIVTIIIILLFIVFILVLFKFANDIVECIIYFFTHLPSYYE